MHNDSSGVRNASTWVTFPECMVGYLVRVGVEDRRGGLFPLALEGCIHAVLTLPRQLCLLPSSKPSLHVHSHRSLHASSCW